MSSIKMLGTGPEFMKAGLSGTGPAIEDLISGASHEIHILAYVMSFRAGKILELLGGALERGVSVRIVINDLDRQHPAIVGKLRTMQKQHAHMKVTDFRPPKGDLHAKVIVADRKKTVIGSANFSFGGMTNNYEIGVLIEGKEAWEMAKIVDSFGR